MQDKEIAQETTPLELLRIEKLIWTWAGSLTLIFLFAWPLLALPAGVFSKGALALWSPLPPPTSTSNHRPPNAPPNACF